MTLSESIEILKAEKAVCELEISNGHGNEHDENFCLAVDVVMEWIDKMYCALVR